MIRTHGAGTLRATDAGQSCVLAGWVGRRRDHGGVAFVDLRDASGVAQVVIRDEILAASGNSVLRDNDPSAHAEVNAIRAACKKVGAPNLRGATMFTSCECCPMCYATAYWARLDKIYYAAAWTDYADLFDDSNISIDMQRPYAERTVKIAQLMQGDAQQVWLEYRNLPTKTRY